MSEHVIVSGASDNWFYLRFEDCYLADQFIYMCQEEGLGNAYPDAGYSVTSSSDVVTENTTLITEEMLVKLEETVEAAEGEDDGSDEIGEFEWNNGWDDEKRANGDPD